MSLTPKEYSHRCYVAHKAEINARSRRYYRDHRDKILEKQRETAPDYKRQHPEKVAAWNRKYYYANRDRLLAKRRKTAAGGATPTAAKENESKVIIDQKG